MTREEIYNLNEGDLVRSKDTDEAELVYTGWNNKHVFEFYAVDLDVDESTEKTKRVVTQLIGAYSLPGVIRLTKMELLYGYIKC